MAATIDRRAARTRRALSRALLSLMLRQGYETISVQDIIEEADVGRSTFYAHYAGKEDLLRSGFGMLRDELRQARQAHASVAAASDEPLAFSLAMFEHGAQYADHYRALASGRGGTVMEVEVRRVLSELVREELRGMDDSSISRELVIQFVVGTFLTALGWWFERKPKLTPMQIDAMFRQLVLTGIGPLIYRNR